MAVVGVQNANAQALDWDADSNVTVNSMDFIIRSGSAATQVDVNANTLVVLVPAASTFTLASAGGFTLTNTDDADPAVVTAQTCSNGTSTVAYTGTGASVTFTPTSIVACSGGGGGGGGGGSSSSTPATPAVPATPATPGEIPGCGNRTTGFSSSSGVSCVGNTATTPAIPAAPAVIPGCGNRTTGFSSSSGVSCVGNSGATPSITPSLTPGAGVTWYNFGTATLKNGSRGEAAKELQRFLNAKLNLGLVVDGIIGPKTIAVIKTWQRANGLVADGLIGPKTKTEMNRQAMAQ